MDAVTHIYPRGRTVDRVSPATRSKIMAAVGTTDTGPERAVRSLVHALGYRYSLRRTDLPGKPDLAFVSRKKVIFVHGCFWHGHCCKYGRLPKSKLQYWQPKIETNMSRDRLQIERLKNKGWKAMVIWQCQIRDANLTRRRIKGFLDD